MAGGWVPFKELCHVIGRAISQREPEAYYVLEEMLKKHRPDFISLLQNPSKNATHRRLVQKAPKEGLTIPGVSGTHNLPEDFVEEALLLSDILDLNEMSAVELLLAGEQQLSRFPGLTRGLVAVLLYHDGRRSLVSALRSLIQARDGVAWTLGLSPHTIQFITAYTDQLLKDGLLTRILNLLDQINVSSELDKLAKGRAIGGPHHRRQLVDLIEEQRSCLADCLFLWAVQTPFSKDDTLKILSHLKKVKVEGEGPVSQQTAGTSGTGSGGGQSSTAGPTHQPVDMVMVSLYLTVVACFNIGEDAVDTSDDSLFDSHYPLLSDSTFVPTVHAMLLNETDWASPSLFAAVKLAWAVMLRECSEHATFTGVEELEDDEGLFDQAKVEGAFSWLRRCIAIPQFHSEEYYIKKLHWMLTSMIINMPLKMKELRNHGDEVAREIASRGADGSLSQQRYFEDFMRLIGDLYRNDPYDLSLEFWSTGEAGPRGIPHRSSQRQLSLHKFVHLCTDLLPAPMFCALINMLQGLSASTATAYHCFEFLKANSPSLGGGGASAAISLDHFFQSLRQYYLGLRQEGVGRQTPTGCAISPQEVEGLIAVLRLIQSIAQLDEAARVVMYESQQWLPVASLFGLVGCPIPRELKAEVLLTLASFAKSPDIAASMIHTLENMQVLNTLPTGVGVVGGGGLGGALAQQQATEGSIQVELEEIESQLEDYRLTRAFLVLLDSLTEVPLPPTLGVGHRVPGFEPYLEFVRDSVLLRFDSRAYQDPSEKWKVARLALEILKKLLSCHELSLEDFVDQSCELPGGGVAPLPKPPGHSILVHMLNDSHLLRKVFLIVDECYRLLSDGNGKGEGAECVAGAALMALQMVEAVLEKQDQFISIVRQHNWSVMVTPLNQLLLGINPRTGKADHLVNIASYTALSWVSPELALSAVRILHGVCHSPKSAKEMAVAIRNNKQAAVSIIHGFVEHLDWEGPDAGPEPPTDISGSPPATVAEVHRQVQLNILYLLTFCIGKPSPNIAHLLLGFETAKGKSIGETNLQDPGVLGSPRTVLHAILSLVEFGQDPSNPIGCHYSNPKLAELCYKVVFQLCSHRDLSAPTLRYLRNNHDFFHAQLTQLPLDTKQLGLREEGGEGRRGDLLTSAQVCLLHQQAWLLKSIAVELRVTARTQLRSHNQRLVNLLLSEQSSNQIPALSHMTGALPELSQYRSEFDFLHEGKRKMVVLLDQISLADHTLPVFELRQFVQSALEEAVKSCGREDDTVGLHYTDLKQLHQLMMREVNSLRGSAAAGQKQSLLEEVQSVLEVVVERNSVLQNLHGNSHLFESWRQLVEVTLHALVQGGVRKEGEVAVLFELTQDLLLKVQPTKGAGLAGAVYGVLLILMAHLRQTVATAVADDNESLLSSLFSHPLPSLLHSVVDNIQSTPGSLQRARAHLYGALLYYLMLARQHPKEEGRRRGHSLWQLEQDEDSLTAGNVATLTSFGEPLMETICRDACSGHDVTQMLALSLLDAILAIDWQGHWLRFMVARGYLAKLCASVQWEDEGLQKTLHPLPETLKALYIYESKMALLTRLAHTPAGSRELIAANCLNYLTECRFIDLRPDHHSSSHLIGQPGGLFHPSSRFVPSVGDRYRQMLLPLLRLLLTVLTCPGAQKAEASTQVTTLIGAHSDVFAAVLKSSPTHSSTATLEELALVTAVIAHSGVGQDWSAQSGTAVGSGMLHIQRLMLAHLPRYCRKQVWQSIVSEVVASESGAEGEGGRDDPLVSKETLLLVQQICANIINYCRVAMTMGGTEFTSPYCRILFSPDLSESFPTNPNRDISHTFPSSLTPSQPQSLGHIIHHLQECSEGFSAAHDSSQQLQRKLENMAALSPEEIQQLVSGTASGDHLPLSHQRTLARRRLKQLLKATQKEMQLYAYISENLMYILWRHLQFYLVHCKPAGGSSDLGVVGVGARKPSMRNLQGSTRVATTETTFDLSSLGDRVRAVDVEQLKSSIGKCLPDSLFKQLLDMEEERLKSMAETRVGFVQALVRRTKRLIKLKAAAPPFTL